MNFPILSSLIILPTIGALFLMFSKENNTTTVKYVALFTSFVNFLIYLHPLVLFLVRNGCTNPIRVPSRLNYENVLNTLRNVVANPFLIFQNLNIDYLGIDLNKKRIDYANKNYGNSQTLFKELSVDFYNEQQH